jgi:hypothetical protein
MEDTKRDLWNSLLDSDMNVRYWGHIARRYAGYDKWSKILVAVTTSGSVAGLQIWKFTAKGFEWSWIYDSFTGFAVITAVALPFLEFARTMRDAATLAIGWSRLQGRYESLWRRRQNHSAETLEAELTKIKDDEKRHTETEVTLPRDKKLVRTCQAEVKHSRALTR